MFSKFHNRQKGFTLIELMIVVVIIGILAALAIPRFMQATVKSKQSEVKGILKQIYTMERTYRQQNGVYLACANNAAFNAIGVEIPVSALYGYSVALAGTGFTATGTVNLDDDAAMDTWTINDAGTLACTSDDVTAS
ncbi:MAG: prepilin-type N-terminal cleavage/methylation domain-containing protein [Planctomycetota bacterium]